MEIDEATKKFTEIFTPGLLEKTLEVEKQNTRFVYYTTADTAMKLLKNRELWFRNVTVMNDFSEISYGLEMTRKTFSGPAGDRFRKTVDSIHSETISKVSELLDGWVSDWELETYIACISVHDNTEDGNGRLSMWRAYGDTAIVINNTPMMAVTDKLGVFSMPVMYLSQDQYDQRLDEITDKIDANHSYLEALNQKVLVSYIYHMFFHTAIGTKHPGFAEEKEWRLYYRPNENASKAMDARTVVLNGVPQIIYALPLQHDPEQGLFGADIPRGC